MSGQIELPFRVEDLKQVLLSAAAIIKGLYQRGLDATRKPDGSLLTEADIQANGFLKRALTELLPHAGWLSEECADDSERLARSWVWIVDPLDGTKEFVQRIPEFSTSVGLVRDHEIVAGGVVNPLTGEGGVIAGQNKLQFWGFHHRPSQRSDLRQAITCVSRSEIENDEARRYFHLVGEVRPMGSIAYKLLRVAAGVEDLTFSTQPKSEWDIAGGVALLRAAGKVYQRCNGEPILFNQPRVRLNAPAVAGSEALTQEFIRRYRALTPTETLTMS
jgi:myo-inositol-1(or 4)-monophosphatase